MAGLTKAQRMASANKATKAGEKVEVTIGEVDGSGEATIEAVEEVIVDVPKKYRYEFASYDEYTKYTGLKG